MRALRPVLPALRRIYQVTRDELLAMPKAERDAYLDDLTLLR